MSDARLLSVLPGDVRRRILEQHVQNWLDGSTYQNDAITRAELEFCGYRIVKDDEFVQYDEGTDGRYVDDLRWAAQDGIVDVERPGDDR